MTAGGLERDLRIDFFRGLALLMIFINHVPGNVFAHVTLANVGFSDAAEVFVLTAGLSAYVAYGKIAARDGFGRSTFKVFARVRQLYVVHLVLFLLVTAISAFAAERFGDPMYLEALALDSFASEPMRAVLNVITLSYLPYFLDILPLYMVLLSLMPALLLLFRLHAFAPLGVSIALFVAARIFEFNLPNYPETRTWFFNPFAWQLLFVIGATIAHVTAVGRWRGPTSRGLTALAAAYVAFAFVVAAPWTDLPGWENAALLPASALPPIDKTSLSLFRLANVLAQAWLVAALLARTSPLLTSRVGRLLVTTGRSSLDVFALGIVLSVIASVVLKETSYDLTVQAAVTGSGLALMVAYALFLDWRAAAERPPQRALTAGAKASS